MQPPLRHAMRFQLRRGAAAGEHHGGRLPRPRLRRLPGAAALTHDSSWGDALILGAERFYYPYKECSALLIADGSENVVQSECRRLFCVQCKVAWHAGIKCDEFQRLKKDERSNEDLKLMKLAKDSKWIRCPSCRIFVSRSVGCRDMRCRCGISFCYDCGAQKGVAYHSCRMRY
ncbi:hypothetical protein SASPL_148660 [Salvia splendens]|uniref:RBR-type E3 ubiquitin transferase n=1 Tax=Salvia splendens TaxID=180675 RepID=A0A8X8W9H0_SALSN|nr:hypothetical protein SASPL_148660 [Salvia splendens]